MNTTVRRTTQRQAGRRLWPDPERGQQKLQTVRQQIREGRVIGTERQTLAQYLERWLDDVVRVKDAPKTCRDYEMIVRVHLIPAMDRHTLGGLTAQHIQAWLNELGKSRAPRTVHYYRATLRAALNRAVRWRLIPYNPAGATEGPKQARKRVEAMSGEKACEILAAFAGHHLEALVTVLLATGMRPGEALGLRWPDVDLEAGLVKVQTARGGQLKRESSWRVLVLRTSPAACWRNSRTRTPWCLPPPLAAIRMGPPCCTSSSGA